MRICVAGTLLGRGGIQTHLRWLIAALRESNHEVLALSFGQASPDAQRVLDKTFADDGSIRFDFLRPPNFRGSSFTALAGLRRRLRQFRPDVYLACGTGRALFILPFLLSIRHRVFHEVMSGVACGPRDSRWVVRAGFSHVVAQAQAVADNLRASFRWHRPVAILPAFPEPLERTAKFPVVVRRTMPLGQARAALFSRLVPHKRALWLVQQWPRLRARLRELHIFGTGPEESLIRAVIKQHGWGTRVFCHGAYPEGRPYVELLRQFDLTLLPTVGAEGAPLVLLESMACGVPFVATDVGGIGDYENPDSLLTPVAAPTAFLAGVESLAARLARGEVNQPALQELYNAHFSFSALTRRWLTFFNSLDTA